ncbi:DUF4271 domain-containing protein [Bacteroidota bacterium]
MNSTYFFYQDTIAGVPVDMVPSPTVQNDSVSTVRKFSTNEVDDIFRAMEKKQRELDSISRVRAYYAYLRSLEQKEPEGFDTTAVPYNYSGDTLVPQENPLNYLRQRYYSAKDTTKPVFREEPVNSEYSIVVEPVSNPVSSSGSTHDLRPDWLLGVIIASLVLLAWLKLFYNKFLDQTIQSVANYQLSTKLLRDQNIFSRRVAFALNLNFVFVGAAFVYLLFGYFNLRPFPLNDILSFLAYAGTITGLLALRFIVSHVIGFVFNKHYEFREYLHQLLLIYKSAGIYLLISIIGIAYIREDLRIYLIYLSGLLLATVFILRLVKGMKIILTNKDVLLFYLILYLCTLEILPILIFYRFFSSSIQAG